MFMLVLEDKDGFFHKDPEFFTFREDAIDHVDAYAEPVPEDHEWRLYALKNPEIILPVEPPF